MEILVACIIFVIAVAVFVSYMRKAFKEGDACANCNADKSKCRGRPEKGKCP